MSTIIRLMALLPDFVVEKHWHLVKESSFQVSVSLFMNLPSTAAY